jgi:hypothetical protein
VCGVISATDVIAPRDASNSANTIVVDGRGGMEAQPAIETIEAIETVETVETIETIETVRR